MLRFLYRLFTVTDPVASDTPHDAGDGENVMPFNPTAPMFNPAARSPRNISSA